MACVHGNPPASCSTCRTLADIDAMSASPATTGRSGGGGRERPRPTPVDIVTDRDRPATRRSFGSHVAIFVVVLVVAGASVWIVSGIVFAFIRLLEIVVVAGVAGTLGYRLGHHRGRHET